MNKLNVKQQRFITEYLANGEDEEIHTPRTLLKFRHLKLNASKAEKSLIGGRRGGGYNFFYCSFVLQMEPSEPWERQQSGARYRVVAKEVRKPQVIPIRIRAMEGVGR